MIEKTADKMKKGNFSNKAAIQELFPLSGFGVISALAVKRCLSLKFHVLSCSSFLLYLMQQK